MANIEELTVDGYIFANPKDAELAKNEIRKIQYIENHTDMSNLGIAYSLYNKALDERYFQTPIGIEYMKDLQKAFLASGYSEEEVKPIPLYTTFARIDLKERERNRNRVTKAQKQEMSLKMKYRNAVLVACVFVLLSIALLFVTVNGATPNALNYKKAITDEYASWEQDLKERENAIRAKERELNIEY